MRSGNNENMTSLLGKRGIRPSYTIDSLPGQEPAPELAKPKMGFGEELFSSGIPHEMKLKLMKLFELGGNAQSFNEGLYSEDYNGMDHDFKGKLSELYGDGPAPVRYKGKKKSNGGNVIGKPMPTTAPPMREEVPSTNSDPQEYEAEPIKGQAEPIKGQAVGGGPVSTGRPLPVPRPSTGFDPQKLKYLMEYANGGGRY